MAINMYGVVLWSDKEDRKAVIWCEDHGDLAFYSEAEQSVFDGPTLDAGDFVQFQLSESRDVRIAVDPRLVAEKQYHGLAERLKGSGSDTHKTTHRAGLPRGDLGDNVVAFAPRAPKPRLAS